jgi:uncharacterized protein
LKLHPDTHANRNVCTAHGTGYIAVSGERYEHPVVVTPSKVFTDWRPQGFDDLIEAHFAYFLSLQPEVLLFGTGAILRFPDPRLYRALTGAGMSVEFMNTPAACRTFNILLGEGRRVVAAILL